MKPMRIVLDENLPGPLTQVFGDGHQVSMAQNLGLAGMSNGTLLAKLEGAFEVLLMADNHMMKPSFDEIRGIIRSGLTDG